MPTIRDLKQPVSPSETIMHILRRAENGVLWSDLYRALRRRQFLREELVDLLDELEQQGLVYGRRERRAQTGREGLIIYATDQ